MTENNEPKILLIHGYGAGNVYPFLKKGQKKYGGFRAFKNLLESGEAKLFFWNEIHKLSIWQGIFLPYQYLIYKKDFETANNPDTSAKLNKLLQENHFEKIVCHSMGCYLFLKYLDKYSLPISVKHVYFVQGDVSTKYLFEHKEILEKYSNSGITFNNFYCPWDYTLWSSAILNFSLRIGLWKLGLDFFKQKLFPLWRHIHVHISSIRDPKLARVVMND